MNAKKLGSDASRIAILLTFAVVLPLLAVLVIVFVYLDLERGHV